MRAKKLESLLDRSTGERMMAKFLREYPTVVNWAYCKRGGHMMYVLHEFPIGIGYKADFVVAYSYSGTWEVHFIELEPVDDAVITRAGRPTKRLSSAISQLGDWRDYVDRNRPAIQRDLAVWCRKKDILKFIPFTFEPSNCTGDHLKDPAVFVRWHYEIVIGRRRGLDMESRRKLNQLRYSGDIEIRSYDLFLDIARNLDRSEANPKESVYVAKSEEDE